MAVIGSGGGGGIPAALKGGGKAAGLPKATVAKAPKGVRVPKASAPKATVAATPSMPADLTGLSMPQLQTLADQQAQQSLGAQVQPLLNEQNLTAQQYAAHAQAIQGFTSALAALLQNAVPQVQQAYTGAADTQGALAHGLSSSVQNTLNTDANNVNANLAAWGAPQTALKAAPNVGDVTYGLGGYIPGSTMAREGAAWTANAAAQPGIMANLGLQNIAANNYAGQAAQQKIEDQIAALAGKEPAAAASAFNTLGSLQAKQTANKIAQSKQTLAARTQALNYIFKYGTDPTTGQLTPAAEKQLEHLTGAAPGTFTGLDAKTAASMTEHAQSIALQQGNLTERTRHDQVVENQAAMRLAVSAGAARAKASKIDASVSKILGYAATSDGQPVLGRGNKIIPIEGTAKGQPKLTALQTQKFKGVAATIAENAFKGFSTTDKSGNVTNHPKLLYLDAVNELRKAGVPLQIGVPYLNMWYRPGQQGRPGGRPKGQPPGLKGPIG